MCNGFSGTFSLISNKEVRDEDDEDDGGYRQIVQVCKWAGVFCGGYKVLRSDILMSSQLA